MKKPEITMMCISNVYTRTMHFKNKGDIEIGHKHTYDHGTLVSNGSVLYEVLDGLDGNAVASKIFEAPNMIFVDKNKYHRITALEDNTVCACIHALRTNDEELIPPDSFIEPLIGDNQGIIPKTVHEKTGKKWIGLAKK